MTLRVYIGHDPREQTAYDVAEASLRHHASVPVHVTPLRADRLRDAGLLTRPVDTRGSIYDLTSNAPASTEFAVSRFLTPILAQTGYALFVDCDVVFLDDVAKLFDYGCKNKAVQVVKHVYEPSALWKMDGQANRPYARKNWSSVMLFNCDHPANRRLSLHDINSRPGRDLHAFYWLHDDEIGLIPREWNWLVGEQDMPLEPKLAHFTLGGPFVPGWMPRAHDDIWLKECP